MATIDERYADEQRNLEKQMTKFRIEPVMCKKFGCGKHLTLEESRMGDHCRQHWDQKEVDIVHIIKFK